MGAVLGAAQALVLRPHVRHPGRWVCANAVGWAPAMSVIVLGTRPDTDWSVPAVVGAGAVTGLTAGAVRGLVTGWFIPSLDGSPAYSRVVLGVLSSPTHGLADGTLAGLRVRGRVTGRAFELPVQFAADGSDWWSCRRGRRPSSGGATCGGRPPWACSSTDTASTARRGWSARVIRPTRPPWRRTGGGGRG